MDKYFYVDTDGRQCGPVEEDKLISNGVTSSTKIWKRGMKGYVDAGKLLPHIFVSEPVKPRTDDIPSPRNEQNNAVKYYYIGKDGHQKGPVKEEELIARGVAATTKIWRKGMPKYIEAGIILPALFQTDKSNSQPKTLDGSKTGNVTEGTSSQTKTVGSPKTGNVAGSTSTQTKITSGSKTKKDSGESSSEWKTFAIIQLIATFVVFLPLAIYFEFKVSESLYEHTSEIYRYGKRGGIVGGLTSVAYFGAKMWPLITIGIAGIVSLISIFKKYKDDQMQYTLSSLGICIGTVILGIISINFPLVVFYTIVVVLAIGIIYNTFKNN